MQGNYKYFRYKRLSDARFLCKLFMKLAGKIIVLPQLVIQHRESRSSHAAAVMTSPFSDDISGGAISPLASYVIDFFLSSALLVFSAFSAIVDTCYSLVNSECLVQSVFCRRILVTLAPDCVINRFTSSEPESATGCSRRPRFAQYVTLTSTQSSARRPISPRSITTAFPAHDFSSINRIYCPANHSNFTSACFRARIQRYGYYLLQRGINCRRGVGSLSATATVVKAMPKHVEGLSLGKTARV